jgi:hypothetical protein
MGDARDALDDAGQDALALHQRGECGEVGPCPYCEDDQAAWEDFWEDED